VLAAKNAEDDAIKNMLRNLSRDDGSYRREDADRLKKWHRSEVGVPRKISWAFVFNLFFQGDLEFVVFDWLAIGWIIGFFDRALFSVVACFGRICARSRVYETLTAAD